MIESIKTYFERQAFGVCEWWGNKLGIKSSRVRLAFIYTSFITLGSPLIVYLVMAFVLDNKEYLTPKGKKKNSVWEI